MRSHLALSFFLLITIVINVYILFMKKSRRALTKY